MEKFLWNAGGAVLFALNILCLMFSVASHSKIWVIAMIALVVADWLYKEKRPTWLEV
jgi:uncharacterized membrane protein